MLHRLAYRAGSGLNIAGSARRYCSANCSCKRLLVLYLPNSLCFISLLLILSSSSSMLVCADFQERLHRPTQNGHAYITACIKSFVMGILVQEPNRLIASFTTRRATILRSDNDPSSSSPEHCSLKTPIWEMHCCATE